MKIGITGGAGFIGSHVADVALERGHSVVILDHLGRTELPQGARLGEREYLLGDAVDSTHMAELGAHTDGIIHLAACLGTQETIRNPQPAAVTNVGGGLNFLEACAQYDIPGVYIGVGNHWMNNTYSITKTTVERFVHMYNKERGTRVNIVRLVNAVGPRQSVAPPFGPAKVRKIGPSFICRALTGAPIEIYGDGEQISDLVWVRDGALALVKALEAAQDGKVIGKAIEVGTVASHTVNEIAGLVNAAAVKVGGAGSTITHLPMRPGEIPGATVTADLSTLAEIGIDPAELLTAGEIIDRTVAWFHTFWLPKYQAQQEAFDKAAATVDAAAGHFAALEADPGPNLGQGVSP